MTSLGWAMEEADRGVLQEDPSVYERCRAEALSTLNYRLVFGNPFYTSSAWTSYFLYLDVVLFISLLLGRYYLCLTSLWTYFSITLLLQCISFHLLSTFGYLGRTPSPFILSLTLMFWSLSLTSACSILHRYLYYHCSCYPHPL